VCAALAALSLAIPLDTGTLALGDLQSISLCEFDEPRERPVFVTVV
jgi:thiamine phosphate synthase YjbQ (UPF0047 family)